MRLDSLEYSENIGTPTFWKINCSNIFDVNLMVAKNGTGKSRTINVINFIFSTISGNLRLTGQFNFEYEIKLISDDKTKYIYNVCFKNGGVDKEILTLIDLEGATKKYIERDSSSANIYYDDIDRYRKSSIKPLELAISQTDDFQKSYLKPINDFANQSLLVQFGTDLGQRTFTANGLINTPIESVKVDNISRFTNSIVSLFHYAKVFGKFDALCESIKNDLNEIGYSISEVGIDDNSLGIINGHPLERVYAIESDLIEPTHQDIMSQGMFRAFATLTILNYLKINNKAGILLVDDIGEGLDYERSTKLIDIIINKCADNDIQCFLSSNDRFIMNKVPLDFWQILVREKHECRMVNRITNPKPFDEFEIVGLNNFDFFSTKYYE